jgi:hypothetical protein
MDETTSTPQSRPPFRGRRRSSFFDVQRKIYWPPRAVMLASLLLGIVSAAGLHGYYSSLNGTRAGGPSEQQWPLRIGTLFVLVTQLSLVFSIRIAHQQWIWRELKTETATFGCIDAAFSCTSDPWSFANLEMWKKVKVGSALALASW